MITFFRKVIQGSSGFSSSHIATCKFFFFVSFSLRLAVAVFRRLQVVTDHLSTVFDEIRFTERSITSRARRDGIIVLYFRLMPLVARLEDLPLLHVSHCHSRSSWTLKLTSRLDHCPRWSPPLSLRL